MSFKRGDRVVYVSHNQREPGIVKRMSEDGQHAFVLYHTKSIQFTEHDLDNYTAARTAISDLIREGAAK
jgi:DNA-binding LacI/PurR family transcriptional regulator